MPVEAVLSVALQIVRGLGTAAFYNIFHHAINPSNLVIVPGRTPEGDWPLVKIIHFLGVAPTFSAAEVSTARFDNSAPFASPEQLEKEQSISDRKSFRSAAHSGFFSPAQRHLLFRVILRKGRPFGWAWQWRG